MVRRTVRAGGGGTGWVPAAVGGVVLMALLPAGAEATRPAPPPDVTVNAPERISQQLTVWDVGFGSARGRTEPKTPGHVAPLTARIVAAATIRAVRVSVDGPGSFTATSPTGYAAVPGGSAVTVSWRWAAPLRRENPPDRLGIRVTVRYRDGAAERRITAVTTVGTPPPPPPDDDRYVSDLPFDFVSNGYGPPERDTSNGELSPGDGGPLRLDGVGYRKGLGLNARAVVGLHLAGHCTRFTAVVGIDDAKGRLGSVAFRVTGDGRTLLGTGRMTGSDPARPIAVDVTGVRRLALVADPTADGQGHDWADWADARLACDG